tara:strand:- start:2771 stop:3505 length:735 start_codon:yes stop_codon:yes gene_type:complete
MQPRLNVAKSACELIEEEVRRFFINKSSDALRNMPIREILTSKVVEHINSYYKFGENDFITFAYDEDEKRLRLENPDIIYDKSEDSKESYIWSINFLHDYDNFCRKLPFWTLSLSIIHKGETVCTYILNPFLDIFLFSEKGSGAVNNQRKVRSDNKSERLIFGKSNSLGIPNFISAFDILSVNSISIELIYLSRGLIDYYFLSHDDYNHNHDCILIAKESGIIIDTRDKYLVLGNEKNIRALNK